MCTLSSHFSSVQHRFRVQRWIALSCLATGLVGCSSYPAPSQVVTGPMGAAPIAPPASLERVNTGSIFQPHMASVSLFSSDRKPRYVGDTLKIDIVENIQASNKVSTQASRDTKLAQKGPGGKAGLGALQSIMNLDAAAAGSSSLQGGGSTENNSRFSGQLAASVINVLPNGNLVVAGDRTISLNGGVNVLRFSGIVDPKDIRAGNIVASTDTVNARMEVVGQGEVSEAAQRSWIQRVLANSLAFW